MRRKEVNGKGQPPEVIQGGGKEAELQNLKNHGVVGG